VGLVNPTTMLPYHLAHLINSCFLAQMTPHERLVCLYTTFIFTNKFYGFVLAASYMLFILSNVNELELRRLVGKRPVLSGPQGRAQNIDRLNGKLSSFLYFSNIYRVQRLCRTITLFELPFFGFECVRASPWNAPTTFLYEAKRS
jgi:hypothetical protein